MNNFEPLHIWQQRMVAERGVQVGTRVWRSCFRKHSHKTKGLAEAAGRSLKRRYDIDQSVYFCRRCSGWHTRTDS